jgi:hypothetical protein
MKKLNYFFLTMLIAFFSCQNQSNSETSNSHNSKTETNTTFLAGHLVKESNEIFYLLGPGGVKWEIHSKDIVSEFEWEKSFEDVEGEPTIIEVVLGAQIIDGEIIHEVEINKTPEKSLGCKCKVKCTSTNYCCAISGFRTYCWKRKCIKTTKRC